MKSLVNAFLIGIVFLLAFRRLMIWYCSEPDGFEKKASFDLIMFESLVNIGLLWLCIVLFCWLYSVLNKKGEK